MQNTYLKTQRGLPENVEEAQKVILLQFHANSLAQLGKYSAENGSEESQKGIFVKS